MVEMVDARRNAKTKEERHDLFSGLLDASQGDLGGGPAITEQELIGMSHMCYLSCRISRKVLTRQGNMFIFLLGGHEVGPSHSARGTT